MSEKISTVGEAKRLHSLGVAVHWLRPNEKVPVKSGWSKGEKDDLKTLLSQHQKGYNIGARLGDASRLPNGKYLAVFDVDIKSGEKKHEKQAHDWIESHFPGLLANAPIVISGRGNGSKHIWVLIDQPCHSKRLATTKEKTEVFMPSAKVTDEQLKILGKEKTAKGFRLRPAWEIDFMSIGKQVVVPPSTHPDTGKQYRWQNVEAFEYIDLIPEINEADIDAVLESLKDTNKTLDEVDLDADKLGDMKGWKPVEVDDFELETRLSARHVVALFDGTNVDDRSSMLFSVCLGMVKARFDDDEILSVLTDKKYYLGDIAYEHARTKKRARAARWIRDYNLRKAKSEICAENVFNDEFIETEPLSDDEAEEQMKWIKEGRPWLELLERTQPKGDVPGRIKPTFKNAQIIFENEIGEDMVRRNLFTLHETYGCSTPWGRKEGDTITDNDMIAAKAWLATKYRVEMSVNLMDEVHRFIGTKNEFHPVRDYLNSLEWDGVPRIERFFKDFLGATEDEPYITEASKIFFCACVARVFQPGIKFDHMVIFKGDQGIGKSTIGNILAGDAWFSDQLGGFNLGDKDTALGLRGVWINEIGELASLNRQQVEDVKAFITRRIDKVRPPYGKRTIEMPRETVFFGTTNDEDFLKDKTGNRRFWPVSLDGRMVKFDELTKMRDQLWAEAVRCWVDENPPLYLSYEAGKVLDDEQVNHMVEDFGDILTTEFGEWLDRELSKPIHQRFPIHNFSMNMLFKDMNGPFFDMSNNHNGNLQRVARILRKFGFQKEKKSFGNTWFHPLY